MNIYKIKTFAFAVMAASMFASCADDIEMNKVDENKYASAEKTLVFLTDKYGYSNVDSLTFNENGSTDFYVNVTKPAASEQGYTISYDLAALERYNKANGTSFQALPENLVTIGGQAVVAAGKSQSDPVSIGFSTADELEKNGAYAIPLTVKANGSAEASADKGDFIYVVRDITKMPNCHKGTGQIVISCQETNDANPLHNLCYTLKESGKYVIDQVILFSGNINYNAETGEVYNFNNENITHVLENRDKYIKPLQDKGMKVILGILCNHDRACCTHLNDENAKKFALELKAKLEAYGLDGVFFDDEYCNRGDYPGFTTYNNFSRLVYECKMAMPDKLVEAYYYSGTSSAQKINDIQGVDYGIQDYSRYSDMSSSYPGLDKSGMIQASSEFARGSIISESRARQIVTDGYGGTMIFSLNPKNGYVSRFNNITIPFYGEETVQTGSYAKDW
mgnify:CR=1 FL=1